jgi:ubiquinol-cytochrome c reductase cytochrome c1 subunit
MKKLLFLLLALPTAAFASGAAVHLDHAPVNPNDQESLQRGARVFVNYCLNCHAASYMRYNRMQDFGLTEPQIKDNLLFAAEKPGETMRVAMRSRTPRPGSAPRRPICP